jgi:nicotinamidase-related amidase
MYDNTLTPIQNGPPILADHPRYVEPLQAEQRFLAPPLVNDPGGTLRVRAWRYWYNARGIVETENRLDGSATAVVVVHPWGLDDGHGLKTPEPAGVGFFCTVAKNRVCLEHVKEVLNPFLRRVRKEVALVGYSLPGVEDPIRKLMYASIDTAPEQLQPAEGERRLAALMAEQRFKGEPLVTQFALDAQHPAKSYMAQTPSTDAGDRYNGAGYWNLPMPVIGALERAPSDRVFYDGEGYPKVREYLKRRGIRHVLLAGYATDMCVISTTCGWQSFIQDFDVFMVGDATLATFPASSTPRFATQIALVNSSLRVLITQASWIQRP